MVRGLRLARAAVFVALCCSGARAQTPPSQELAGPTRRPAASPPAAGQPGSEPGSLSVPFRTGSATLTPTATRQLDAFCHHASPSGALLVEGFADTPDAADTDRDLAQRRADAVARYLATLGVDRVEVTALVQAAPYARRAKVRQESK